jgi:actin-related protein
VSYLLIRYFSISKDKICFLVLNTNNENRDLYSVVDNLRATSIYNHNDTRLLYGSENIDNLRFKLCEYDIENKKEFNADLLDGQPVINSQILTKRYDTGTESNFRSLMIKARGRGEVIVTPIIDGIICDLPRKSVPVTGHRRGDKLHFFFDADTHAEEQFAPRANNAFNYIGHDIQLKIECIGKVEKLTVYHPMIGYKPLKLREGGKRHYDFSQLY